MGRFDDAADCVHQVLDILRCSAINHSSGALVLWGDALLGRATARARTAWIEAKSLYESLNLRKVEDVDAACSSWIASHL